MSGHPFKTASSGIVVLFSRLVARLTGMPPESSTAEPDGYHAPKFRRAFLLPRYWGIWLGIGMLRLIPLLPRRVLAWLGALGGDLFRIFNAKRRLVATTNIAMCFPDMAETDRSQLVRRHFRLFVQCLVDLPLLWFGNPARIRRQVQIRGLENYEIAFSQGRRIIVLTAHFVALEFGAAALSARFPMLGMIKPLSNPLLDWVLTHGRKRFDPRGRLLLRDQGLRPVVREIRAGLGFYYLPDEDFGAEMSIFVPFFATQVARLTALGRLAQLTDAVVIPCFTYRLPDGQGYEVRIDPPLDGFPSGDLEADTRRMNAELEKHIALAPEQYMWTFKYFKTRPGGAPSPYERH